MVELFITQNIFQRKITALRKNTLLQLNTSNESCIINIISQRIS